MHRRFSYVAKSPIHGRGLFAKKKIRKGTRIGLYEGERVARDDTYVLWVEDGTGGWFGIQGENDLRFLNHANEPNAEFTGDHLFAIRTISTDSEITFDYGPDWNEVG